jgi:HSP20 family protein
MSDNKSVTTSARQGDPQHAVLPAVDVFEDASGITLLADMPGVAKDRLELRVEGETLSIEGEVQPATPEGLEALYAELRVPRFRRSFTNSIRPRSTPV